MSCRLQDKYPVRNSLTSDDVNHFLSRDVCNQMTWLISSKEMYVIGRHDLFPVCNQMTWLISYTVLLVIFLSNEDIISFQVDYKAVSETCNMYRVSPDMIDSWLSLHDTVKYFGDYWRDYFNYTKPGSFMMASQVNCIIFIPKCRIRNVFGICLEKLLVAVTLKEYYM